MRLYAEYGLSFNGPGSDSDDKGYNIKASVDEMYRIIKNGLALERTYLAGTFFPGIQSEGPKTFSVFSFVPSKVLKMLRRGWTQQLIQEQ